MGQRLRSMNFDEYEEFWNTSQQSSPFNAPWFIHSVTNTPYILSFRNNSKLHAALYFEKKNDDLIIPKFSVYHSILISSQPAETKELNNVVLRQRLLSDLLEALKEHSSHFELSLHPSLNDIRSFSWSNFHSTEKISIEPRYTAIKNIAMTNGNQLDISTWGSGRKYDLKKSIKMGLEVIDFEDISLFKELYKETFDRQSIQIKDENLSIVEKLFHAIPQENRVAKIVVNRKGRGLSAGISIIHKKEAFGLFVANGIESRNTGSSTLLIYHLMIEAYKRGARQYDFVGVNSPNRGNFKLSFNSSLQTYYETFLK